MDRRGFLVRGARVVGAGLLAQRIPPHLLRTPVVGAQETFPDLVAVKDEPRKAAARALESLGGIGRFLPPNGVVLIKPNASFVTPPEWGATTHPDVLGQVIDTCLQAGARRVIVADHTMGVAARCFERACTVQAVDPFANAKLISLDDQKMYREVPVPQGKALKKTEVASVVAKADLFINMPTAKCHNATEVALGLKNLMGLVWDRNTFHNDMDIHVGIADLATVVRPQLTILDAIHVLQTNGPTGPGEVNSLGLVVAGVDPVAVDAYGVGLSSWNNRMLKPSQIDYLRFAAEHGIGTLDLESLNIVEHT